MIFRDLLALALSFALAVPALAQDPPPEAEIANWTMDNGLEVVVIPDHRAPIVTHMVWYRWAAPMKSRANPASLISLSI